MKRDDVEALARLLQEDRAPLGPPVSGAVGQDASTLAALASALSDLPPAQSRVDDEFRAALRAALIDHARLQVAAPPLGVRVRRALHDAAIGLRWSARTAAAASAVVLALSTGGVAVAAEYSLPGDTLYSVKRGLEDMRLTLTPDEVRRGQLRLSQAETRLDEAEASVAQGDPESATVALRAAEVSVRQGAQELIRAAQRTGDVTLLQPLEAFAEEQGPRLAALAEPLTDEAQNAAGDAQVALLRISQRLAVLQGSCGGCSVPAATGPFDFASIPHADEPFTACPCVPEGEPGPSRVFPAGDGGDDSGAGGASGSGSSGGGGAGSGSSGANTGNAGEGGGGGAGEQGGADGAPGSTGSNTSGGSGGDSSPGGAGSGGTASVPGAGGSGVSGTAPGVAPQRPAVPGPGSPPAAGGPPSGASPGTTGVGKAAPGVGVGRGRERDKPSVPGGTAVLPEAALPVPGLPLPTEAGSRGRGKGQGRSYRDGPKGKGAGQAPAVPVPALPEPGQAQVEAHGKVQGTSSGDGSGDVVLTAGRNDRGRSPRLPALADVVVSAP